MCAAEYKITLENHAPHRTRRACSCSRRCRVDRQPPPQHPPSQAHMGSAGAPAQAGYSGSLPGKESRRLARRHHPEPKPVRQCLLQGPQRFPDNTLVEMVFEMPEEISGQKNSTVLCQGRIIRTRETREAKDSPENTSLAASILDYKFVHPRSAADEGNSSH